MASNHSFNEHLWHRFDPCQEFVGGARTKHTAVAIDDGIFVFGGHLGTRMSNDVIRFDTRDCSWSVCMTTKGIRPSPRTHHSCDVLERSLYVFGGYTGNIAANSNFRNCNDLYEYRADKGSWRLVHPGSVSPPPDSELGGALGAASVATATAAAPATHGGSGVSNPISVNSRLNLHRSFRETRAARLLTARRVAGEDDASAPGHRSPPWGSNPTQAVPLGTSPPWHPDLASAATALSLAALPAPVPAYQAAAPPQAEDEVPCGRAGHSSCIHNDYLYIFGGFNGTRLLNDMWRICLSDLAPRWECVQQHGTLPAAFCNSPAACVGDFCYMFSGMSGKDMSNRLFRCHLPTATWSELTGLPRLVGGHEPPPARFGHILHYDGHARLWVFGGVADGRPCNTVHCYHIEANVWAQVARQVGNDAPSPRSFAAGAVLDRSLFVFGGTIDLKADEISNEMFRFDLTITERSTLATDLLALWHSATLADIDVVAADTVVPAHAVVLAARSSVLAQRIAALPEPNPSKPGQALPRRRLVLRELSNGDTLQSILHLCYSDRLPPSFLHLPPRAALKHVVLLYACARWYKLHRFMADAVEYLTAVARTDLLLALLALLHEHRLQDLLALFAAEACQPRRFQKMVQSDEFATLDRDLIVFLVRRHESSRRGSTSRGGPVEGTTYTASDDPATAPPLERALRSGSHSLRFHALELDLYRVVEWCLRQGEAVEASTPSVGTATSADVGSTQDGTSQGSSRVSDLLPADEAIDVVGGLADCQLVAAGQFHVPLHRAILAARCQYFHGVFCSGLQNVDSRHTEAILGDAILPPPVLTSLLRYIYADVTTMPVEHALQLQEAHLYFGMTNARLSQICRRQMQVSFDENDAVNILLAAHRLNDVVMIQRALATCVHHFEALDDAGYFDKLPRDVLLLILKAMAESSHSSQLSLVAVTC